MAAELVMASEANIDFGKSDPKEHEEHERYTDIKNTFYRVTPPHLLGDLLLRK